MFSTPPPFDSSSKRRFSASIVEGQPLQTDASFDTYCLALDALKGKLLIKEGSTVVLKKGADTEELSKCADCVCGAISSRGIFLGFEDGRIERRFEQTEIYRGHEGSVLALVYDSKTLISGGADQTVRVWNLKGDLKHVLSGHRAGITALACYGKTILSGSWDRTARVWNKGSRELCETLLGATSKICSVALNKDNHAYAISSEGACLIWDLNDKVKIALVQDWTATISLDGFNLNTFSSGNMKVWSDEKLLYVIRARAAAFLGHSSMGSAPLEIDYEQPKTPPPSPPKRRASLFA